MKEKEALNILLDLVEKSCTSALNGRKVILTHGVAESWIPLIDECRKLLVDKENVYIYFSQTYGFCIESIDTGREIGSEFGSLDDAISYAKANNLKIDRVE